MCYCVCVWVRVCDREREREGVRCAQFVYPEDLRQSRKKKRKNEKTKKLPNSNFVSVN